MRTLSILHLSRLYAKCVSLIRCEWDKSPRITYHLWTASVCDHKTLLRLHWDRHEQRTMKTTRVSSVVNFQVGFTQVESDLQISQVKSNFEDPIINHQMWSLSLLFESTLKDHIFGAYRYFQIVVNFGETRDNSNNKLRSCESIFTNPINDCTLYTQQCNSIISLLAKLWTR